jgi:hypothetical protein
MKKIIMLMLISVALFAGEVVSAKNPKIYARLGNELYNNLSNVENLKNIIELNKIHEKIDTYASRLKETKQFGFEIDAAQNSGMSSQYLLELRALAKQDDFFKKTANELFKESIRKQNSNLFASLVNSGMIDIRKNKREVLSYYKLHSKEIDSSGVIKSLLDEEKAYNRSISKPKANSMVDKEKIERFRRLDKAKREDLERELEQEAELKKQKIQEMKERELFN